MMNYKSYTNRAEFDSESKIFHGEVLDTKDVITFRCRSVNKIECAFHASVDGYFKFWKVHNKNPNQQSFRNFVLKMDSDIYKILFVRDVSEGKSLNKYIVKKQKSVLDK